MKALKYLFLLILVLIIGGSIYIATLNGEYNISSKRNIAAPAEVIFNNINDYKNWNKWGPWHEIDSTIITSYPEATSGVGASYSWTGIKGNGSMKTLSLIPNKELIQEIKFATGSLAEVYWNISETDTGNELVWGMRGKNTFGEKLYWLTLGGIQKNIKPMFDRGLQLLDTQLFNEMNKHSIEFIGEVDYGGGYYLYQTTSCKINDMNIKMCELFGNITKYITDNSVEITGNTFTLTHKWDEENKTTMFSACFPIKERIITTGDVLTAYLKPQKTFKSVLNGNYKFMKKAWNETFSELTKKGFIAKENGEPFEVYKVSRQNTKNPAKWVTEIYIPIE